MSYNIPLIDFSKCGLLVAEDSVKEDDLKQSGNELYSALSTAGFAYLSNHGIEWKLVDEMNEEAEKFYARPAEYKAKFQRKRIAFSYESVGTTKYDGEHVDYYEALRSTGEAYTDEKYRWPNDEIKKSYMKFADICGKLLLRLLRALGYGMKLKDREYFCKIHSLINQKGNYSTMKTVRYPPIKDGETASENRIGVHSDRTTLTILFQDDIGGLQVLDYDSGKFLDVQPVPGAIVLNIGDILEAWSGNRLKATKHRVCAPLDLKNRGRVRRSVVYFSGANDSSVMKKLVFEDDPDGDDSNDGETMTVLDYLKKSLPFFFEDESTNDD